MEEEATRGRIVAKTAEGEGELTFSKAGDARIVANHTGVPDAMGGQGIGTALVERLHRYAVDNDVKVVANCPFVKSKMAEHPEWRDALAR